LKTQKKQYEPTVSNGNTKNTGAQTTEKKKKINTINIMQIRYDRV
jgi:hypothetical protein